MSCWRAIKKTILTRKSATANKSRVSILCHKIISQGPKHGGLLLVFSSDTVWFHHHAKFGSRVIPYGPTLWGCRSPPNWDIGRGWHLQKHAWAEHCYCAEFSRSIDGENIFTFFKIKNAFLTFFKFLQHFFMKKKNVDNSNVPVSKLCT